MHIQGILKTIDNFINPDYVQTLDNNIDPYNAFENSVLTEELIEVSRNQKATMELLKEYVYFATVATEGLILTEKDKRQRAEKYYKDLLESNFIIRGQLSPHIIDEITSVIER